MPNGFGRARKISHSDALDSLIVQSGSKPPTKVKEEPQGTLLAYFMLEYRIFRLLFYQKNNNVDNGKDFDAEIEHPPAVQIKPEPIFEELDNVPIPAKKKFTKS